MSDDVTLAGTEYLRVIPRTKPVPELILDEITRLITEGILKPGDRLPSESELAERFGVGRSSLREAMRALQLLGIIEVIQGKGTFLRQTYVLPLASDWTRISRMGLISQVMEARQIIEVAIAQLAAERATEEDIAAMRAAIRRAEQAHGDPMISGEASVEFHLALAEATHNEVLALMYKTVREWNNEIRNWPVSSWLNTSRREGNSWPPVRQTPLLRHYCGTGGTGVFNWLHATLAYVIISN